MIYEIMPPSGTLDEDGNFEKLRKEPLNLGKFRTRREVYSATFSSSWSKTAPATFPRCDARFLPAPCTPSLRKRS